MPRTVLSTFEKMFSDVILQTVQGSFHSNSHATVRQFKYSAQENTTKMQHTWDPVPVL